MPNSLPQLSGDRVFLTDGGLETTLVFHRGLDLPHFASYVLLDDEQGRAELRGYFEAYLDVAREHGAGFVLDTATWRSNPDWAAQIGHDAEELDRINRDAVKFAQELRDEAGDGVGPIIVNGVLGPRGDGYAVDTMMSAAEAERYHSGQIRSFAAAGADMVSAITMTYAEEAIGIARAAKAADMPVAISFTVETDGRLPTGEGLGEAIRAVDEATGAAGPAYYMLNCAHPTHFADVLRAAGPWAGRLRGLRANASCRSHAELDAATELDDGGPEELGAQYAALRRLLPGLAVLGGCCGTDHRHVGAIARACRAAATV
jgi:homocysteine S-methyltransferase